MATNRYCVDYAKRAGAACKKCKQKLEKGVLRLGKVTPNPFSEEGGDMKQWHHPSCLFEMFAKARATTKKIEEPEDIEGWEDVTEEDKDVILKLIEDMNSKAGAPKKATPKKPAKAAASKGKATTSKGETSRAKSPDLDKSTSSSSNDKSTSSVTNDDESAKPISNHRDNSFREFRKICAKLAEESSYLNKTGVIKKFFAKGSTGDAFHGDLYLWIKLLLPGIVKRVYNIQSKQLVNHFSQIFGASNDDMIEDLEKGDVAETIHSFFEKSTKCPPAAKSGLMLQNVDNLLDQLTKVTRDEDQIEVLKKITKLCTSNDLKMVIRLIKKDLRINAGAKHILDGVHPDAYQAFQMSRDLKTVINKVLKGMSESDGNTPGLTKSLSIRASLMTPILPMLAEACKSIEQAMKKCPNGMFAEIKYDGERVQVHKQGDKFSYFSRSLKPVMPHKVRSLEEFIPKAFPHGQDIILDSEVLLIDSNTGTILPFGTLGKHKKAEFPDANVCLFVFDCVHFNGENLITKPLKERRRIMRENMTEVPNRIMFSEMKHITRSEDLKDMIMDVLRKGLEGLVLKDRMGVYEPGKRHWLKVKKDYLADGVMADSADLVVLGAFYGTGNKGGIMSIFLMGCHNPKSDTWCTVTKVSGGHDDKTLQRLQKELDMVKISKDADKVPKWLNVTRGLVPDLVCKDPRMSQVWEIVGAEFTKSEAHTAHGISIRFPRVTKIRDDKTWKEATSLPELEVLFKKSKEYENISDFLDVPGPSGNTTPKKTTDGKKASATPTSSPRSANNSPVAKGQKKMDAFVSRTPEKRKATESDVGSTSAKKGKMSGNGNNSAADQVLPNVFSGVHVYLPKKLADYDLYHRHIIAYDGNIIDDHQIDDATHIIRHKTEIPEDIPKGAFIVNEQWLVDSIKLTKLQDPLKYVT